MKHEILVSNGSPVQLVRYFSYQGKNYLIFSRKSDVDEQGYITIHISEVVNEGGLSGVTVEDQISKNLVKVIANANKNNLPLDIVDLDYNTIDGINILSDKAYRVLPNYVDILSMNQPIFNKENNVYENLESVQNFTVTETQSNDLNHENHINEEIEYNPFNINNSIISNANENVINKVSSENNDYEKMYLEQLEVNKNLNSEIEVYKNKIEILKNIINN